MAMRSVVSRTQLCRLMEGNRRSATSGLRYFSDGKGRVLSEEERAAESIYIQVFAYPLSLYIKGCIWIEDIVEQKEKK